MSLPATSLATTMSRGDQENVPSGPRMSLSPRPPRSRASSPIPAPKPAVVHLYGVPLRAAATKQGTRFFLWKGLQVRRREGTGQRESKAHVPWHPELGTGE